MLLIQILVGTGLVENEEYSFLVSIDFQISIALRRVVIGELQQCANRNLVKKSGHGTCPLNFCVMIGYEFLFSYGILPNYRILAIKIQYFWKSIKRGKSGNLKLLAKKFF